MPAENPPHSAGTSNSSEFPTFAYQQTALETGFGECRTVHPIGQ
jgi:hypothetical protein